MLICSRRRRSCLTPSRSLNAALRGLDGLRGSDDPADVVALVDLTAMVRGDLRGISNGTTENSPLVPALRSCLVRMQREGSPRMQGAAWGALAMLALVTVDELAAILASWYDGASTTEGRGQLRSRLQGLLVPLLPLVSSDTDWLSGLESRFASSADDEFLVRLPALRGGFHTLTPADRARLLADRLAVLEPGGPAAVRAQHDRRSRVVRRCGRRRPRRTRSDCSALARVCCARARETAARTRR